VLAFVLLALAITFVSAVLGEPVARRIALANPEAFDPAEQAIMRRVIRLADRSVQTIMTSLMEVIWLDLNATEAEAAERIRIAPHSRVVAARGEVDRAEGTIRTREFMARLRAGEAPDAAALGRVAPIFPDTASIVAALEAFQAKPARIALVIDEHGGLQGIATPTDILAAITGVLAEDCAPAEEVIRPHGEGFLVEGQTPVD
jgi:putative hemolysin